MKNQALFSSNDKSKILNGRLLQFLFGALRVKAPITTAAVLNIFHCFSEKIRLDKFSYESFAYQRIPMKHQALFSLKDNSKKIKESSAAI